VINQIDQKSTGDTSLANVSQQTVTHLGEIKTLKHIVGEMHSKNQVEHSTDSVPDELTVKVLPATRQI
jgi:hypothetical protein